MSRDWLLRRKGRRVCKGRLFLLEALEVWLRWPLHRLDALDMLAVCSVRLKQNHIDEIRTGGDIEISLGMG